MRAYVLAKIEAGKEDEAINALLKIPEVKRLMEVLGPYDLIAEIEIRDEAHLNDVVIRNIRALESIRDTLTLIVAREHES
ncbi:MAG: Lrp/AsnC family transcriptional regulator [Candidatus Njordarchaeales archaeon]